MVAVHPSAFGSLLKRYRLAAELTQEELAERARLSARAVSDLERGIRRTPYRDTVRQLADALDLTGEELRVFETAARRSTDGAQLQPSLHAGAVPAITLPDEPTPFIGREKEVATIAELLQRPEVRLVSLTGPAGIGKTRLALRVAAGLVGQCRDGVSFVSLASIGDPGLVPAAIARAMGIEEQAAEALLDTVKAALATKRLLLVLDNFEHLLAARSVLVDLLDSCRELQLLVTSRSVLHLSREHEYPVPPLSLPDPVHLPDLAALQQSDAVTLFIDRAQAAKPHFSLTTENASAVAQICHRLEGLPLAIELAAARIRLFPPQALVTRLSRRLELLTGGAHDLPARHQALRSAIDWSYSLLSEQEQVLFARLSVFAGGCTLEAAEVVCPVGGDLGTRVLDGVASLVEQSLLRQEGTEEPRLIMLETIREYAQERMEEAGVSRELKRQHAHYYLHLAEESSTELPGPGQTARLEPLEAEHDNLRVALQWARQTGDMELGLRLAVALGRFWEMRGPLSEGQTWLDEFLTAGDAAPKALRAEALFVAGQLLASRRHRGEAAELFERSLALCRELGDKPASARAVGALALELLQSRDLDRAAELLEEGIALARELGDKVLLEMSLRFLGVVVAGQGDAERARELRQQSVAVYRELEAGRQAVPRPPTDALQSTGSVPRIYATVNRYLPVWFGEAFMADPGFNRVLVARSWGDYGQAARLLEDLVAQALDLGDRRYATYARLFLGLLARDQGDYEQALTLYSESLAAFQDVEDAFGTAMALIGLSDVARDQGEAERVIAFAEESLGLVREIGDALFTGFCLHNLGLAARYQRDYERAEALFAESLALLRDPGISGAPATEVLSSVGLLALERGDYQQAEESFSEALQTSRKAGVRYVLGTLLDGMASVALGQGQTERAGRLFGAAESVRDRLGTPRWPANEALYQKYVALTREALGEERFARIREEARPTTVDEAIAYARNDAPNAR